MLRKATISDAKAIYALVNKWAKKGVLLQRSLNHIYENIRNFWVKEDKGKIVGVCSLDVIGWEDLGEIKSLVVDEARQKKGIGRQLVRKCLQEAAELGITKVFALTFVPRFFERAGFKRIDKNKLPHKIWSDCINCVHFPKCKEEAVIIKITA